jgi:nitrogen fixation protein
MCPRKNLELRIPLVVESASWLGHVIVLANGNHENISANALANNWRGGCG